MGGRRAGDVTTNKHKQATKDKVLELLKRGHTAEALGRKLKGLVDRTTIQLWKKELDAE